MIEQTDKRLREWAESVLDGTTVTFAPPAADQSGQAVSLYLMEFDTAPPPRGMTRPPLQFTLVYLVTAQGYEPDEAHRLLGELIFAALDSTEFEVDLKPLPYAAWTAFGVPPQPSFFLRALARRDRPEPEIKYVRRPLVIHTSPLASLEGVVLGPGDIPLVGARVEVPGMQARTQTDSHGRFTFSSLPTDPPIQQLRIRAKGREQVVAIEPSTDRPLVIRFDLLK
ncbi:MAG: DUF4255 domain-containing protein [Chloroflexi bacterium]|nr:DUF4255 domain-containing protein [Chloroflexota bacterium]